MRPSVACRMLRRYPAGGCFLVRRVTPLGCGHPVHLDEYGSRVKVGPRGGPWQRGTASANGGGVELSRHLHEMSRQCVKIFAEPV